MPTTRRHFLRAAAALTGAALLAACGTPEPALDGTTPAEPADAAAAPPRALDLSVLTGQAADDLLYTVVYLRDFKQQNPGQEVEFASQTNFEQYYTDLFRDHAAGQAPDVQLHWSGRLSEVVAKGLLQPLDDLFARHAVDTSDFLPSALAAVSRDGKIYASPQGVELQGLYYNKRMFDAAGLAYPDDTYTFERMLADAQQLTKKTGERTTQYGIAFQYSAWQLVGFILNLGGALWDRPHTPEERPFPDESWYQALGLWRELIDLGVAPSLERLSGLWFGRFFQLEQAAMALTGSWFAPFLTQEAPKLSFGVAPFPGDGTHPKKCPASTTAWGLSAQTQAPEQAWKLFKYVSSSDALLKYWQTLWSAAPARYSALRSPAFKQVSGLSVSNNGASVTLPAQADPQQFEALSGWILTTIEQKRDTSEWTGDHMLTLDNELQPAINAILGTQPADIRQAVGDAVARVDAAISGRS